MRRGMEKMDAAYNEWTGPPFTGSETYHEIPMRDGFMSSLKIQRPASGEAGPLIVLAFGGGFVVGSNEQFIKTGRVLVNLLGATVVSISYRLVFPQISYVRCEVIHRTPMWIAKARVDANSCSSVRKISARV